MLPGPEYHAAVPPVAPESRLKIVLALVAAILAGLAFLLFSGDKWSGYRWNNYMLQEGCIPARLDGGKGTSANLLELAGDGDTAPYFHSVSLWSCANGRIVAIYGGLPENAPTKLLHGDAMRFRRGLMAGDDAHRFVKPEDVARLKSIRDWVDLVSRRPL